MDDRIIKKMLRGTMVVMVVTVLSTMLGMVVDGIVTSRFLGQEYMSAYGLANPIFNLLVAINGVLAAGIQVLCAKHIGTGEIERAKQVHTISVVVAFVIAVVLALVLFFGADGIGYLLGAKGKDAGLLPEVAGYLRGISIGVPGLMIAFVISSFMQIDSDRTRTIIAVVVMTVVNVTGDLLVAFVFHGGLFEMGLATTISYYVALIIGLTHYLKKDNVLTFYFHGLRIKDALQMIRYGAPSGVVNLCITMRNIVMNRLLLLVATSVAVAAYSIQNTITAATNSVATGLGMAVLLVAGIIAGEEDRESAVKLIRVMMRLGFIIAVIEGLICFFMAEPLAAIFAGNDSRLLDEAAYCVKIYAFGFIGNVLNSQMENYVQGLGRVALANLFVVLDTFVYSVVVAWTLGWGFSLPIGFIWAAWAIGEFMVMLTIYIMAWKREGHMPRSFADYNFFPKGFGVDEADTYSFTVYEMQELIDRSIVAEEFCLEHGTDPEMARRLHLCIEEFGSNIIKHGFTADDKKHSIDVRISKKGEKYVIRIRDDCKPFNPEQMYEMRNPDDPTQNIGISIVFGIASSIQYVNTMDLNNLVVEIGGQKHERKLRERMKERKLQRKQKKVR